MSYLKRMREMCRQKIITDNDIHDLIDLIARDGNEKERYDLQLLSNIVGLFCVIDKKIRPDFLERMYKRHLESLNSYSD